MVAAIDDSSFDIVGTRIRVEQLEGDICAAEVCFERERTLRDALARDGIGCYVPMLRVKRERGGRKRVDQVPVFPGYAFVAGGEAGRELATRVHDRRGRCVFGFVEWGLLANGKPDPRAQRFLRGELQRIQDYLDRRPDAAYADLMEGSLVEIINGPFLGQIGTLENRDRLEKFTVRITTMGASRPLETSPSNLQLVSN